VLLENNSPTMYSNQTAIKSVPNFQNVQPKTISQLNFSLSPALTHAPPPLYTGWPKKVSHYQVITKSY